MASYQLVFVLNSIAVSSFQLWAHTVGSALAMLMYLSVGTHYSVKRCKVTIFLPNNMLWNTLFFTHHRKKVILSMNLILFNAFCGFELAKWHYCDILS